jgi:hypothetical protein
VTSSALGRRARGARRSAGAWPSDSVSSWPSIDGSQKCVVGRFRGQEMPRLQACADTNIDASLEFNFGFFFILRDLFFSEFQ